jgi:CheY-like chemotaxis protein
MLFYDLEARLETETQDGLFRVRIRMPYRKGASGMSRCAAGAGRRRRGAGARPPEGPARRHRRRSAQPSSSARRPTASRRWRCWPSAVDVALVDIRMPRMDGIELARHLAGAGASAGGGVHHRLRPVRRAGLRAERHRLPAQAGARAAPGRGAGQGAPRPRRRARALARLAPGARRHLSVSERGRILLVPVADILYLKAELKYVTARTASASTCSTNR